jgi:hypothetical protein
MIKTAALTLLPLLMLATPGAASAQSDSEKLNMVNVFGDDACPQSTEDVITICRKLDETERYRIPKDLREDPNNPKNEPRTGRVQAYETVGAQGIASCSPVGPGGASGCLTRLIDAAYKERRDGRSAQCGQLIEAERAKRLSTIDAEAAATQARVEQLEKEYEAKLAREREAEEAAAAAAPLPTPPGG